MGYLGWSRLAGIVPEIVVKSRVAQSAFIDLHQIEAAHSVGISPPICACKAFLDKIAPFPFRRFPCDPLS